MIAHAPRRLSCVPVRLSVVPGGEGGQGPRSLGRAPLCLRISALYGWAGQRRAAEAGPAPAAGTVPGTPAPPPASAPPTRAACWWSCTGRRDRRRDVVVLRLVCRPRPHHRPRPGRHRRGRPRRRRLRLPHHRLAVVPVDLLLPAGARADGGAALLFRLRALALFAIPPFTPLVHHAPRARGVPDPAVHRLPRARRGWEPSR
uniref:Uncharacterized protein n=1 Tax=Nonomuraea gerenzanensis TaxID=93944 RepID=A0A1M4EBA3_9ACTN|nr:hypothetical protein BN4615_P5562 [Nonomuraea gerenzanensis]